MSIDEGFRMPEQRRRVIASWVMPDEVRERCGCDVGVGFRLLTVPDHALGFAAEIATYSDGMGAPAWQPMNSPAFAVDVRVAVMVHCAGFHMEAMTKRLVDSDANVLSQQMYIEALETELSSLRESLGDRPTSKLKVVKKKRNPPRRKKE